jgi:hypothetical protein
MLEYTFTCPHCGSNTLIIERATILRDTALLGFNKGYFPEFETLEEPTDSYPNNPIFICASCEEDLGIEYNELYDYVKKHSVIRKEQNG